MDVLSPLDAAFLEAEDADEHVSMAICSVGIFEGTPPAYDDLVRALATRLPLVPRYCQRVRRFPFDLVAPVWVNDPDFDIGFHVRRTALPAPGGEAELNRLVGRVMSQRLDRDRPLWETWLIEGLEGDRWALLSKVHHCMVDGVAGTELYHLLLSPTPQLEDDLGSGSFEAPDAPSELRVSVDAARRAVSLPLHLLRAAATSCREPIRLIDRAVVTGRGLISLAHVLTPTAPSELLGSIGRQRRYAATTVSLDDIKRVRRTFGVTVNDVALTAATAGFREVLLRSGGPVTAHSVRALVPTNVRVPGTESQLANRVSCMFADLPVDLDDPAQRLRRVHDLLAVAKSRHEAEAGEVLVELADYEPFSALAPLLRMTFRMPQRSIVTVTTNVPGPREPLYLLGRKMTRLLPFVPIANRVRLGVAILSYCDEMSFGITGDYERGSDIDVVLAGIRAEISALLAAGAEALRPSG